MPEPSHPQSSGPASSQLTPVQILKGELRRRIRRDLSSLSGPARGAASAQACERLKTQSAWNQARSVLCYVPLPDELDVWPLVLEALTAGKEVFLPAFDAVRRQYVARCLVNAGDDLSPGQFGIAEPTERCRETPLNQLDFALIPGVAFDLHGRRLGRGRGYYDQILAAVRGKTCGVAFDEQIVAEIPVEPHDITVRCILTPSRWVEPGLADGSE